MEDPSSRVAQKEDDILNSFSVLEHIVGLTLKGLINFFID